MTWPTVDLDTAADVIRGVTFSKGDASDKPAPGLVPVLRAGNIGDQLNTEEDLVFVDESFVSKNQRLQPGDIVVCLSSGSANVLGKSAMLDSEWKGSFGAFLATVRPRADIVFPRFLAHYLRTSQFRAWASSSSGIGIKNIRVSDFKSYSIPLPPLDEQRRIAAILDQADVLRRLRARAVDKLNTLGQAIFHEMFEEALQGDFFEFGQAVEEFRYGTSNKSGEAGLPTLRIPNVIGGGIDTAEIKTVEVTGAELVRLRLRDGDVLFVRTNGNPDYVGRCAAFSFAAVADYDADADWIFASYLIRARLSDRINPAFAKTFFASHVGRSAVRERCKTSAGQYNINTEGLASLPFPDVPRPDQDKFAEVLAAIEQNSAPMKRSAAKMNEKFASLQHRAFMGEL
ncbi:restriction endonuclease subunit S [Pseudomonas aeruginosa]|uniref:restriction endonuclease subunit S n=1 Tax=Pseudomonas aeruginosa TaxID=287 RepID=UPI003F523764